MQEPNDEAMLREWLRGCPYLAKETPFRVDYLSDEPVEYAIFASPSSIKYHENVLGERVPDTIQTANFIFASKEVFGKDAQQNLLNYAFHQAVSEWMLRQNASGNLPQLCEGRVRSIVPTLTPYVAVPGADSAKYQIQIQITYKRTGR